MKEAQVIAAELVTGLTMKSHETPLTPCDLDLETSPSILFAISRHHHTAWEILHAFGDPKVPWKATSNQFRKKYTMCFGGPTDFQNLPSGSLLIGGFIYLAA